MSTAHVLRCLLFVLLALCGLPAAAQEKDAPSSSPDWQAHCTLAGGETFSLDFHSVSQDMTNDDMRVTLQLANGKPVTLPLPPAWYHAMAWTGDADNRCDGIVATPAGPHRVLLWLAADDRPSFSQLTLVLVDLSNGRTLAQRDRVGAIKSSEEDAHLVIRHQGGGYETRIVRDVLTKTNDDSAYNYIEDWLRVGVTGPRIDTAWR
jgi:hypothetical protein